MSKATESYDSGKKSWFGNLSAKRKLVYALLVLFIVSWCFFLGFHAAGLILQHRANAEAEYKVSGTALNEQADNFVPTQLTGYRTILAVGYDVREGYEVGRSDTIIVAFLNMDDKSIKLLSIPRDSYVYIPGGLGCTKINHAFSYGGVTLVKETVEYLLGITIDDYVAIDFEGFKQVVDAVGGVEVYVESDMINWDEHIEIYTGLHTLNGEQGLGFCRYRGEDCSDYERIQHQQYFIRQLIKKVLSLSSVTKISSFVDIFMKNVDTSISTSDMLDMATYAFSMDLNGMQVYTIPGYSMYIEYGGYWLSHEIINESELISILTKIAGDDFDFHPNVIDPGDAGSYTIPEGGLEYLDDDFFADYGGSYVYDGEGGYSGEGEGGYSGEGEGGSGEGGYSGEGEGGSGESGGGEEDFGAPVDIGDTVGEG